MSNKTGQNIIEYAVLVVIIISMIVGMANYVRRALSGKWREVGDTFGSGRQYEPSTKWTSRSSPAPVPENDVYGFPPTLVTLGADVYGNTLVLPEITDVVKSPFEITEPQVADTITQQTPQEWVDTVWPATDIHYYGPTLQAAGDVFGAPSAAKGDEYLGPYTPSERADTFGFPPSPPQENKDTYGAILPAQARDTCSGPTECWQLIASIQTNNYLGAGASPPNDTCNSNSNAQYNCGVAESNPGCTDVYPSGGQFEWRWVTCDATIPSDSCPGADSLNLYSCGVDNSFTCKDIRDKNGNGVIELGVDEYRLVICAKGYNPSDYQDTCDFNVSIRSNFNKSDFVGTDILCGTYDDKTCVDVWDCKTMPNDSYCLNQGNPDAAYYRDITCVGGYEPFSGITDTCPNFSTDSCIAKIGDYWNVGGCSGNQTTMSYLTSQGRCNAYQTGTCTDMWYDSSQSVKFPKPDYRIITCNADYDFPGLPECDNDKINPSATLFPPDGCATRFGDPTQNGSIQINCVDIWDWGDPAKTPQYRQVTCRDGYEQVTDTCMGPTYGSVPDQTTQSYLFTNNCLDPIGAEIDYNPKPCKDVWDVSGAPYYRDITCRTGYAVPSDTCDNDPYARSALPLPPDGSGCVLGAYRDCTDVWPDTNGVPYYYQNIICNQNYPPGGDTCEPVNPTTKCAITLDFEAGDNYACPPLLDTPDMGPYIIDIWNEGPGVDKYRSIDCDGGYYLPDDCDRDIYTKSTFALNANFTSGYCGLWDSTNNNVCTDVWQEAGPDCGLPGWSPTDGWCVATFLCNPGYILDYGGYADCSADGSTFDQSPDLARYNSFGYCLADSDAFCRDFYVVSNSQYYQNLDCNSGYDLSAQNDTCDNNKTTPNSYICPQSTTRTCVDVWYSQYYRDVQCVRDSVDDTCNGSYSEYTCTDGVDDGLNCTDVYKDGLGLNTYSRSVQCIPGQNLASYLDTCPAGDMNNPWQGCQPGDGVVSCRDTYLSSGIYYYQNLACLGKDGTIICDVGGDDPNTPYPACP